MNSGKHSLVIGAGPGLPPAGSSIRSLAAKWFDGLADVNRELWLLLSMFAISGLLNWLVASHGMVLSFYTLPTLFSAYVYGRRHAVLTALGSVLLVVIIAYANPALFSRSSAPDVDRWFDLSIWAGLLIVTAYAMGTLYERKEIHLTELRKTYFGVLAILQQFVSNDKYTHNHSNRVAFYAVAVAERLGLSDSAMDDVRAAALLHDIGKLESSRDILYKASTIGPQSAARGVMKRGIAILEPVGGSLNRVIPIILAHHERSDAGEGTPISNPIPVEARILALADAYDTLTSDRPYRRAVTPFEAKQLIVAGAGTSFDPKIVDAFISAFDARELEIPESLTV